MMDARWWVLCMAVAWASGCGPSQEACRAVTCSNRGQCVVSSTGAPRCLCNAGHQEVGLTCVLQSSGPSCAATGQVCTVNGDCCAFQQGTGSCVSGRCSDSCTADSQCVSGCCGALVSGGRACGPASACSSCAATNGRCTRNGDCCSFLAGRGYCVDGFCADSCARNADCVSNCCAPLVGGGSTCAGASACR